MTTAVIPITIEAEAEARIAALGMQREFEQMLDKAQEIVPHLHSIRVALEHDPEGELDAQVVIWLHRGDIDWQGDQSDWEVGKWMVRTFPPDVCTHFATINLYEPAHAG